MRQGKQTYNVTYGSQTDGKQNIKEGKTPRGYWDGVEAGNMKARRFMAYLLNKHLEKKKKKPTKNAEKALVKFQEFINLEEEKT